MKSPRKDPLYRIFLSWGYNVLLRIAFGVQYVDMDTGFRLFRRSISMELSPQIRHMSFFTAEFVIRAHFAGYRIMQVPVRHYARKIGSTSIFYVSKLFVICFQQFPASSCSNESLWPRGRMRPHARSTRKALCQSKCACENGMSDLANHSPTALKKVEIETARRQSAGVTSSFMNSRLE